MWQASAHIQAVGSRIVISGNQPKSGSGPDFSGTGSRDKGNMGVGTGDLKQTPDRAG
jgi:hypothetical protein